MANAQGKGSFGCEGCIPDPLGASFVRDIYERCGAPPGATFSVPILYDRKTQKIVNNESSEIIRLFNTAFNAVAKFPKVDMYPAPLREAIDSVKCVHLHFTPLMNVPKYCVLNFRNCPRSEWVYHKVNNGVYRCGFAKTQAAYEDAFADVSDALSRLETILSTQRYVAGDFFTEADIRLFATLIRFDCGALRFIRETFCSFSNNRRFTLFIFFVVYVVYFKTDTRLIRERTNLLNYVREIYQIPAMRRSVNFDHIKTRALALPPLLLIARISRDVRLQTTSRRTPF